MVTGDHATQKPGRHKSGSRHALDDAALAIFVEEAMVQFDGALDDAGAEKHAVLRFAMRSESVGDAQDAAGFDTILGVTFDHLQLVAFPMIFAILVGVSFGVVAHRVPVLRGLIIGVSSILLTIPSLALFSILIPINGIGIGDRPAMIALFLYALLPILRNTIVGLEEVDTAVSESAKGMGLGYTQRLLKVELPLAWPVILTGIRISTLLNIGIAAIASLVGGTGLGEYVRTGLQRFPDVTSVERMWTGVVFTVLLALVFDAFIAVVRKLTTSKGLS